MNPIFSAWLMQVLILFLPVIIILVGIKLFKKFRKPTPGDNSEAVAHPKQKSLLIAVILVILQFGLLFFLIFSGIRFSENITGTYLLVTGLLAVVFAVVSLVRKEAGFGLFIVVFEIFVGYVSLMGG